MATELQIELATPSRLVLSVTADEVVMPGVDGYLGVLPGHAPLLVLLAPGEVSYRSGLAEQHLAVSGGFAEVAGDRVTILADTAELPGEIDGTRARAARERAEARLAGRGSEADVDFPRALAARARADTRLQTAARPRRG